jgi:hypothetical protein
MIVNVPNHWWKVVDEGRKASLDREPKNPYLENTIQHDYWELGRMAESNGWDIEY